MSKKKVLKNTLLYTLSTIGLRASSIIFFPIFSYYLSKEDYGVLSISQQILKYITLIGAMQLSAGITRFVYDNQEDKEYIPQLVGTAFTFLVIINLFIVGFFFAGGHLLLEPLLNEVPFLPYIAIALCSLPFVILFELYKAYFKAIQEGGIVFKLNMSFFALNVGMNLFFVAVIQTGVLGILVSNLISNVIFFSYAFFTFYRKKRLRIHFPIIKKLLLYGGPLVPSVFLSGFVTSYEIIILNSTIGAGATGIYYISITFSSIFSVLKESLNQSVLPWFFQNYRKLADSEIKKTMRFLIWGVAVICLGVSFFGKEILLVLSSDPELTLAWEFIPPICFAYFIYFIAQQYNFVTLFDKKNIKYLPFANIVGLIFILLVGYTVIPAWGIWGAAIVKIIVAVIVTAVFVIISFKPAKQIYNLFEIISIVIILGLLLFTAYIPLNFWLVLLIKILVISSVLIIYLYFLNKHYNIKKLVSPFINKFTNK